MPGCGAKHPDDQNRTCMVRGKHADHMDIHGTWTDPETEQRIALVREQRRAGGRKGTRKRVNSLAAAAIRGREETIGEQRAKHSGMEQALHATPEDFREGFLAAVRDLAERQESLTSDDVWEVLEARGIDTESRAAVGPLMASAAKKGWLKKTDERAVSNRPGSKARDGLSVWQSLLFAGSMDSMGEDPPPHPRDDTSISDTPASEGLGRPGASEVGVSPVRVWGPQ